MFRRARLTVRPNVRPPGRAAATGAGGADPEPPGHTGSDTPAADGGGTGAGPAEARRAESDGKADNTSDAGESSKPAEMLTQRRKRISTMPNLAKPRAGPLSAQRSAPKLQRRTSQASDGSASLQKDPSPSEKSNIESSVKSPMLPEKKTPVPQVPQFSPLKKSVNKEQTVAVTAQKNDDSLQKNLPSPLKERPTQEKSRTQEEKLPVKPSEEVKRTCSDRERILKARKLREMLKEELKKERMKLKHRPLVIEGRSPPDRSKMTMRDLIYYLPENNPMKSSLVEERRAERSSALSQMKEQEQKSTPDHEEEEEEEENGEESQDGPLLVPRVKVAEDGSIILDEESLTVEVLRTKGPCVVEENDPIFERGSTTTYSSFRKSFYTKPWSNKETDMFFLAISMVGTDFSLIGRLFPHRARAEIKNKFKREEKANGWRIDKAFKEKRPFDFEFFAQLLEKVLADEGKRKQKTVKSQKPKEKKSPRPQKKSKAKAASTEAANVQDELQEAGISDAETEADGVTAEKENEDSLSVSEQAEQVALEPALAKKKRKRKRKDDFEQEVENISEEMPVSSKTAEEGKSSNKRKKVIHASSDDHTTCGEEVDCAVEGKQNETAVTEEERSEPCSPVNNQMEREGAVSLCSLDDSNDAILEAEPAKLKTRDTRDDTSQESQIPELPVSNIRNKETQSVETTESKNEDTHPSEKADRKQSASEGGSQSEIMKTEKSADRRRLQRPKPNLVRSSGRRQTAAQDKVEARTSSPTVANAGEKCSEEDSRRNRNEATELENRDLGTASQEPEKTAVAKTVVRGYRQRFKPNVSRASGRKEPEKDARNDEISHLQAKEEKEKNNSQDNRSDVTSEDTAEKDEKDLVTVSQSNEMAGLKEDGKQFMLNQTPLKRGRMQRPKPNLGRAVARQKELIDEKDPEEGTAEGGEAEKGVIHHRDQNNDPCLKSDLTVHEDIQPSSVTLEDVSTDSEMNSIYTRQCFQEKSSEAESYESEKGLSDVSKQVSDSSTGESHRQKEEEKTVVLSAQVLRTRFQRPKPNLRTASRKEVLDVNCKGASQKDANKEEGLTQCDSECSIPLDKDKVEKSEVLNALESLGNEKSLCSQEVSERPSCKSPRTFSSSEEGELEFCLPETSQDDISTTIAGTQEEDQQAPLPPIQLAQNKRCKPNLVRTVGKKELQVSENERKKKPEAEQKDEFDNTGMGENEAVLCQADELSKEEQEQQEVPQVLSISETLLSEQSSTEKFTSREGKLSGLKQGQFARIESPRTRPNLERTNSKKVSPVVQKLAAPDEEEMNQGENLPVAEESENLLSSKDDMEVLLLGNLAKNDNLDINSKSMTSGMLCFSKESPNCNSKREQEQCLSTDAIENIQDTTERSNDKLSSGEETEQRAREPHWNPRPDLVRLSRKRDYPEECENREEDNTERNEGEFLVLLKRDVARQNSSNTVEAGSFSEATRKCSFAENVEETSCKRIRQQITFQSPEVSSESESREQDNDSQLFPSQEKHSDNLTRRQFRRSSKQTAMPEHVLEPKTATSASECEADCREKGSQRQEAKLSVTRDKGLKITQRKKSGKEPRGSKTTFVTLRASQEEEEEEDEEADDFELEDEDECFPSEEVNKAPVFVPIGLRSPKPVPVQIQETMEELEISVNIPDVQVATDAESLYCASIQPVVQREEKEATIPENPEADKGINDGSTEAAMTLLAMGDPNFQLKTSTEEQTQMSPAQVDLDMADSLVIHTYSKENRTSSLYSLGSDTSVKELLPSEDGNNINVEHQITGTRIGVEEYSETDATDTSGSSLPVVNSVRLTGGGHLKAEPTSGIFRSDENVMQEILNTNAFVEQGEQIQTDPTTLRGNAEMQEVEPEPIKPPSDDSSVLYDFATGSMELTKTEKQVRAACGNSEDLRHLTASPKPETSYLGLEDGPNPSSVDEQIPCPLEHHICTVNFTQNEACTQDAQQHCLSSTEETSVVNDDHTCPEEEQTYILTLVEIPTDSKEFDASAVVEQTSEPVLPAPILISPVNASETTMTEVESIESLTTAAGEVAAPLNSSMETKQLESAVDRVPKSQTAQKRLAAEVEENDFPTSKKTPSTVAVEENLETTYKGYSIKSTDVPVITSGNPFQKTQSSAKEKVLTSVLVSESISQLAEKSQLETLESSGKAPLENPASKKEEEVTPTLTANKKAEISGQVRQENVHKSAQLEHTGSPASSSKTPLLRGGRKPLGFLSLICKKSNSESAEDTKGNRGKIQKPRIVTPKRNLKKPTPSTKGDRESCSFPSTSSSVEHEHVAADAAVMVPSNNSSEKPTLSAKDQEKEGEPTKISEYFFSDIFMEVDDSE